jgi:hypothetical protein
MTPMVEKLGFALHIRFSAASADAKCGDGPPENSSFV